MNVFLFLRKDKELTQSELAQILNVKQNSVSRWEKGVSLPDYPTLINCANFFNVTTDYLLGRTDDYVSILPTLSIEEQRLLKAFNLLDARAKARLIEDAEYFAKKQVKV